MTPDDKLDELTGGTRQVSLHTGDPGDDGAAMAATLHRVIVDEGTWTEYIDIDDDDGRMTSTGRILRWPGATGPAFVTHLGIWHDDTFLGGAQLQEPVEVFTDDEPWCDIGAIIIRAVYADDD